MTLTDAITQAAEHVNAQIVFAHIPESRIPLWTKVQQWMLSRKLARQKRQWIEHPIYAPAASSAAPDAIAEISH
jgi:hypothetical protein